MEIWKTIDDWPNYEISNQGRLRNKTTGHIPVNRKPNGSGYLLQGFRDRKRGIQITKGIHWLVAKAFIPNPDNLPTVEHLDRNTLNNNVDNLTWASWETQWANRDNKQGERNAMSKLTQDKVNSILELSKTGISQTIIAKQFGISQPLVSKITRGLRWTHITG